jgi:hypothetical protein
MTKPSDLPANFRRIDLALAREPEHPTGDPSDRYVLIAPLTADHRLDSETWRDHRQVCRVVRHQAGETAIGRLIHGPGGQWRFHYDITGEVADETGYRLGEERFIPGEYVSIVRDNESHPYQVAAVGQL